MTFRDDSARRQRHSVTANSVCRSAGCRSPPVSRRNLKSLSLAEGDIEPENLNLAI